MTASQTNNTATAAADTKSLLADSKTLFPLLLPSFIQVLREDRKVVYNLQGEEFKVMSQAQLKDPQLGELKENTYFYFTKEQLDRYLGESFFKLIYLIDCLLHPKTIREKDAPMLHGTFDIHSVTTIKENDFPVKKITETKAIENPDTIARQMVFYLSQLTDVQLNYFALLPMGNIQYRQWFVFTLDKYMPQTEYHNILKRLTFDTFRQLNMGTWKAWTPEIFSIVFEKTPPLIALAQSIPAGELKQEAISNSFLFHAVQYSPEFFASIIKKFKENKKHTKIALLAMVMENHPDRLYRKYRHFLIHDDSFVFPDSQSKDIIYPREASIIFLFNFLSHLIQRHPIENIVEFLDLFDERVMELNQWLSDYPINKKEYLHNDELLFFLRAIQDKLEPVLDTDSKVVVSPHIQKFYNAVIAPLRNHDAAHPITPTGYRVFEQGIRAVLNNYVNGDLLLSIMLAYLYETKEMYEAIQMLITGNGLLTFRTSEPECIRNEMVLISKKLFTPIPIFSKDLGNVHSARGVGIGFLYDAREHPCLEIRFRNINSEEFSRAITKAYATAQPYTSNYVTVTDASATFIHGIYIEGRVASNSWVRKKARSMRACHFETNKRWLPIFFYHCEAKAAYPYTEAEQAADKEAELNAANSQSAAMTVARKK